MKNGEYPPINRISDDTLRRRNRAAVFVKSLDLPHYAHRNKPLDRKTWRV